ncbi:magnesium-translocating P-type ATPase [Spiroplasma endosymbiont of Crioceris asparagi]|uniref:magnesium-translocating P-type ATPase n=1 Tax=Spiroplasma endosymbiont of Crioceris asparagi TaxID=3066286 RepID=UPI0030D43B6E
MFKKTKRKIIVPEGPIKYTNLSQAQILKEFNLENFGLNSKQVFDIKEKYGDNEIKEKRFNFFMVFLKTFFGPFNLILTFINIYSFYEYFKGAPEERDIVDLVGALIILTMIVLSGSIGFFQEVKSHIVMKKMFFDNIQYTKVIRNPETKLASITNSNSVIFVRESQKIDKSDLVIGDVVYLSNGDIIPADVKILWSNNLYVDQASLTGESFPVSKKSTNKQENYLEFEDVCYMGTTVTSGSAIAIVVSTGQNTYFATISSKTKEKREPSSFEKGIKKITLIIILFMLVVIPFVLIAQGLKLDLINHKDKPWINATIYAIAIAVGITPEMLPMIVTANLSYCYKKIKNKNVIVKNLNAVQNLGAIDILCSDKTGTITSGEINLSDVCDIRGVKNIYIEELLYFNSYFQTGFTNPIDNAVLASETISRPKILEYKKSWEIPFNFERKILSVIYEKDNQKQCVTKGAVEEVLKLCTKFFNGKTVEELNDKVKQDIHDTYIKKSLEGYRVIGIAHKLVDDDDIEEEMVFYGFGSFFDEPKTTSKKIIRRLATLGVETKILTGDNEIITKAICNKVDFKITSLVTGVEIDRMDDFDLERIVMRANVFVKLSPLHKARIINTLKGLGHVVGFMGDGINDAPVLRASDVAISFADASNIAQDAADVILMEDNLMVLEDGVIKGRSCLANMLKYIKVTIASNFGNVLSILIALFILSFNPMQPIHLLIQNLLYDITQFALIVDKVDYEYLQKPQKLKSNNLIKFAAINGSVSSIFDVLTFVTLLFIFKIGQGNAPSDFDIAQFNASWFIVGLLTQTAIVQVYRTQKIPFINSKPAMIVLLSSIFIILMAFLLPYTNVSKYIKMERPSYYFIPIAIGFGIGYVLLAQVVKMAYIKIFKEWL